MDNNFRTVKTYLKWAPVSLVIREYSRISSFKHIYLKYELKNCKNILDIGCGDGHWWQYLGLINAHSIRGIDVSKKEIDEAKKLIDAEQLDVTTEAFIQKYKDIQNQLIIGNCSLEHIRDLEAALSNIYYVLEEDGYFVLFVPTPYWALQGKFVQLLNSISPRISMCFSGLINGFFQHWHLYNFKVWTLILSKIGFKVLDSYGLGNKRSDFFFRLYLIPSFFSFIVKSITGKYLNYFNPFMKSSFFNTFFAKQIQAIVDQELIPPNSDDIFEYIIVCRK